MRNMNDSTLNWEPRLRTEKKSTPKTRANSLQIFSGSPNTGYQKTHEFLVITSATSIISATIVVREEK